MELKEYTISFLPTAFNHFQINPLHEVELYFVEYTFVEYTFTPAEVFLHVD